jgi:HK97 gp10 family phage protein
VALAGMTISGTVTGLDQTFKALALVSQQVQKKILRDAVTQASKPVLDAARQKVPVNAGWLAELGLGGVLKKSLARRVTTSRKKGSVTVTIGPRRGFKMVTDAAGGRRLERTAAAKVVVTKGGRTVTVNPTRIAPLVELGHGGPHPAPAHPFLRPAWDENKSQVEATLKRVILEGIEAEAKAQAVRLVTGFLG